MLKSVTSMPWHIWKDRIQGIFEEVSQTILDKRSKDFDQHQEAKYKDHLKINQASLVTSYAKFWV